MSPLPQELIDSIINQVDLDDHYSLQTLSACSTVARSFLPASRARLWSRLEIPENYADSFEDDIVAVGSLVRTLALHCNGDLSPELFAHFPKVNHVEFLDDLEFLPIDVLDYIVKSWNVSVVTLRRATFSDVCMDLIPIFYGFPNLTEIKSIKCSGIYPRLGALEERMSDVTGVVSAPESLYIDLTSVGVGLMRIVLSKSWFFSLERVKHLTFSFSTNEGDPDGSEEMMHEIMDALPLPLHTLCFKCHESLSLRSESKLVPVATIARVAFDIYQDGRPLETIKWWTRNLVDAWANHREQWAIREICVNVIIDCRVRYPDKGVFDDLLVPDAWDPLDSILAMVKLEKLVVCVQAVESIDEEEALDFEPLLKDRLPLSRARKIFYWGDMLRFWRYD